jgi:DNA-binding MarR family transcriptional regulator
MFKPIWERVRAALSKPIITKEPEVDLAQLPIIERVRVIYSAMDLSPYQKFTLNDGRGKVVQVAHPTIEACVHDITRHIQQLERQHYIDQERVQYQHFSRPINRFLLTEDGCYLPSVYEALRTLQLSVLELISHVEQTQPTDYYSYNLRMLNALLFTLYDLGTGLMEIAAEIKFRS